MGFQILSESYGRRLPKITAEADSTDDLATLGTNYAEGSTCVIGDKTYSLDKVQGWVEPGSGGGGGGSDLPAVTSADNGDVLKVIDGAWGKGKCDGLFIIEATIDDTPSYADTVGYTYATYDVTFNKTGPEIVAAYESGKLPVVVAWGHLTIAGIFMPSVISVNGDEGVVAFGRHSGTRSLEMELEWWVEDDEMVAEGAASWSQPFEPPKPGDIGKVLKVVAGGANATVVWDTP